MFQEELVLETSGRGTYELSERITNVVRAARVETGLCHLFCRHTSASLMICENADPGVLRDLETFFAALAPDGDPRFDHDAEGPDDMPAHVRTILTQTAMSVPITGGQLGLGTWQGIFLYEHRKAPHRRCVLVTIAS